MIDFPFILCNFEKIACIYYIKMLYYYKALFQKNIK